MTCETGRTERYKLRRKNLVLIGMPGSGKTTAGMILARRRGRPFVDLDAAIAERDGRAVTDIFAEDGEAFFRDLESRITAEVAEKTDLVIATGGGCVLRGENVRRLRRNGVLFFLDRPLEALLPMADRPLADTAEKLRSLYLARRPVYLAAADVTVSDPESPEAAAEAILSHLEEAT